MAHKTKKSIPKTPDPNANEIISNFNRTGGTEAEARALQKRLGTIGIFTKPNDSNTWYVDTTICLLYTSPSPRDRQKSRMPSSA